ncbi:hypothetical protein, partial [Enterococcus casseliflavus]|uniref:hypothetical protein n=1 Tax=Enterococcus casseliflavus TaxID=37734 RepID=UPI003D0B0771
YIYNSEYNLKKLRRAKIFQAFLNLIYTFAEQYFSTLFGLSHDVLINKKCETLLLHHLKDLYYKFL